ncbi:TPA: CRISPR-associated ring nuclease Csm6 [Photobacterium damselae]
MKNILVAVTGASPQVLTETIYALYKQGKPLPSEVYVITTKSTRKILEEGLFEKGNWQKLLNDYQLPKIKFSPEHIWLITDDFGHVLDDAKGEEDQSIMADFITRRISELTDNNDITIHASIAGGRKTMAFYMGYAMSLYGRRQDILSHVFINDEFEFEPEFYYPTPNDRYFQSKKDESKHLNAKDAKVTLAEIPYVRMRNQLEKNLMSSVQDSSFSKAVARMNAFNQPINVVISYNSRSINILGIDIKVSPKLLAIYLFILKQPNRKIKVGTAFTKSLEHSICYLDIFDRLNGDSRVYTTFGLEDAIAWRNQELDTLKPISPSFIQTNLSTLHKKLQSLLPNEVFDKVKVNSDGAKGGSTYHIDNALSIVIE